MELFNIEEIRIKEIRIGQIEKKEQIIEPYEVGNSQVQF